LSSRREYGSRPGRSRGATDLLPLDPHSADTLENSYPAFLRFPFAFSSGLSCLSPRRSNNSSIGLMNALNSICMLARIFHCPQQLAGRLGSLCCLVSDRTSRLPSTQPMFSIRLGSGRRSIILGVRLGLLYRLWSTPTPEQILRRDLSVWSPTPCIMPRLPSQVLFRHLQIFASPNPHCVWRLLTHPHCTERIGEDGGSFSTLTFDRSDASGLFFAPTCFFFANTRRRRRVFLES